MEPKGFYAGRVRWSWGPYPALMLWFLSPNSLWCSGNTALGQGHRGFLFPFHCDQALALKFSRGPPLPVADTADCERLARRDERECLLDHTKGGGPQAPDGDHATNGNLRGWVSREKGSRDSVGPGLLPELGLHSPFQGLTGVSEYVPIHLLHQHLFLHPARWLALHLHPADKHTQ